MANDKKLARKVQIRSETDKVGDDEFGAKDTGQMP